MSTAVFTRIEPGAPIARSSFTCHHSLDGTVARLSVEGELDIEGEARFAESLDRCQADAALVIVDLRALELLSCGGLRRLLNAARRARATGGRLVVVRGPATVQRLFDVIDVTLELELVDRPPERLPQPRSWRGAAA